MGVLRSRFRGARACAALVATGVLAGACSSGETTSAPAAEAVPLGTTSTTMSPENPPVVIGGAPGPAGHLPVRLNPRAWEGIAASFVETDALDPYHDLHSEGHDDFWWGAELHTVKGAGWTGEQGLFATDCFDAGICVRFDPDGGAGPIGPILAEPNGEVEVEQLEGGYSLVFRNLVFVRDDGVSYRIDSLTIEA